MIDRGKRNKTLSEVKPLKNISKNLQSFLNISLMQKEVLRKSFLHINLRPCIWAENPLELKEDNSSQRNYQNQLSYPSLSDWSKNVRRV